MASVAAVAVQPRVQLGLALGERAKESVLRTWELLGSHAGHEHSSEYEEHRRLRTFFGTLFIARWLVTGIQADEHEHGWMVQGGRLAVAEGVPMARTTRGYYCWRDSVCEILRQEADRLETPPAVLAEALAVTCASCDASLLRMAADQDRHREETMRRLAESESRFRGLYETMACGVMVVDPAGQVLDLNQATVTMLGTAAAERLRTANLLDPRIVIQDECGIELATLLALVVEHGQALRDRILELPAAADRPVLWVQADVVPSLHTDGRLAQVVITFIDVTAVKEAERLRAEGDATSRFLATMSHELRTPLNSVLGFAQLLRMRLAPKLDKRELRYVENIEVSGRHLLGVINNILDLTSVSDGKLDVIQETVRLRPLMLAVRRDLKEVATGKGLRLEVAAGPALEARADPARTRQVVLNLVSNALKFTSEGLVRMRAVRRGDMVEIAVADTGIGIAPDHLDLVLNEFTQVEAGSTRAHDGAGLGLALAHHLVELMGGTLSIESSLGQGTTARVLLPAVAQG